jgi:NAD(P)-dependent dehydrogenase (short-subunit alcohol dehydrogenase family)
MLEEEKKMDFTNQTVVVTGASNGIGKEIAITYAKHGANVVLADVDESGANEVVSAIVSEGGKALFIPTDVRKEADVVGLMEATVKAFNRLDILINNAGKGMFKPLYELSIEEWDDVINTNLRSVFLCSREAAKSLRNNPDGGAIINISSTRAFMSEASSEAYAATKGGIIALTHALAASLGAEKITVNAISPGWIETGDYSHLRDVDHKQHFSQRVGSPSDIARACLFLSKPENNFITGTNLTIDGGMTKKMQYEE